MTQIEIITVKEAAELLRCSVATIRRLCREGVLPYRQRGNGPITFSKAQVLEWWQEDLSPLPFEIKIKKAKLLRRSKLRSGPERSAEGLSRTAGSILI
jgi:excisionase family DNA binding protein